MTAKEDPPNLYHAHHHDSEKSSIPLLTEVPNSKARDSSKDPLTPDVQRMVIQSLCVCTFYVVVSGSMVFVNKAITYTYRFRSTNFLLLLQMLFTTVLLRVVRAAGIIKFDDLERTKALKVAPVSLFYSLNAAVALLALRELSVPSYTLIKRLAPLFTLALEYVLLRKRTTYSVGLSLLVMTAGTVMAAKADSVSALSSWILGLVSCLFQALYLTFVKRSGVTTGMSSFGILYYHSILSIPFISIIVLGINEMSEVRAYRHWASPSFLIVLGLSLTMGVVLNYALFLCTELTSPTSTVVAGQVKAMAQTAIGMFTFGGVDANFKYVLGTLLNISGGVGYAYSKYVLLRSSS